MFVWLILSLSLGWTRERQSQWKVPSASWMEAGEGGIEPRPLGSPAQPVLEAAQQGREQGVCCPRDRTLQEWQSTHTQENTTSGLCQAQQEMGTNLRSSGPEEVGEMEARQSSAQMQPPMPPNAASTRKPSGN